MHELSARLEDPACRLLTVIGPGGCGKTRLAIDAAYRQVDRFKHGVYFIAMAGVHSPQAIPQATAQALGFLFGPEGDPWQQILNFLRQTAGPIGDRQLRALIGRVGLVVELLLAAPG